MMKRRVEREIRTVGIMIDHFCRHRHGNVQRCQDCRELFDHARQRAGKCPFGEDKPVCGQCPIHCYKPKYREKIRAVMKFSGPRMIFFHPFLALRHMVDAGRGVRVPIPPSKKKG